MSFEIDWSKIQNQKNINETIKSFFNTHLSNIELPSYIKNLRITNFEIGSIPPSLVLKQISDPLPHFYYPEDPNHKEEQGDTAKEKTDLNGKDPQSNKDDINSSAYRHENDNQQGFFEKNEMDIQFLLDVEYKGDLLIEISAEVVLNYPTQDFLSLPLKLSVSNIGIHSLCLVAYLKSKGQLFFSCLCDVSDDELDNNAIKNSDELTYNYQPSMERIQFIRRMDISSVIGGGDDDSNNGTTNVMDRNSKSVPYASLLNSSIPPSSNRNNINISNKTSSADTNNTNKNRNSGNSGNDSQNTYNTGIRNVNEVENFILESLRNIIRKEICWPGWIDFEFE
ncbi:related to Mitochondrial distribution and morphology protein 12 [Saccharomycodes ludwigii]|uniref:Mitochondrial distribution and morphology protein 12 n=1 Tax=Saccharomycodes ludwigii TaxID=36035 RepID=A0A376B7E8_9ASCO|nr:related to Mitochondrial distribution and morphology protein 12 [Saccharomycodes ludwigii]